MKKVVLVLGLLTSMSSFACSVYEAQFVSRVKEVRKITGEPYACEIMLDINLRMPGQSFKPSMMCPLSAGDVYEKFVYSRYCDYQIGDVISGYLVKTDDKIEID